MNANGLCLRGERGGGGKGNTWTEEARNIQRKLHNKGIIQTVEDNRRRHVECVCDRQ